MAAGVGGSAALNNLVANPGAEAIAPLVVSQGRNIIEAMQCLVQDAESPPGRLAKVA